MAIQRVDQKDRTIWFDDDLISQGDKRLFDAEYWRSEQRIVGSAQGRGTTWFVQTDTLPAALRHYRRGGLWGKLIKDQYWFSGWENTRSYQEFMLLNQLHQSGVNVPRPLAALATKQGLTYQADLLSERIANAQDLVGILEQQALKPSLYHKVGQEIAKMHQAQVNHTDLNIHNILIDNNETVWIIDFDKCAQRKGEQWKASNLERLKRSFIKEVNKRSIHWQEADFDSLLSGYHSL